MTNPKPQIDKLPRGQYVVFDGWNEFGRRINPFGTYNRETASEEFGRRDQKRLDSMSAAEREEENYFYAGSDDPSDY